MKKFLGLVLAVGILQVVAHGDSSTAYGQYSGPPNLIQKRASAACADYTCKNVAFESAHYYDLDGAYFSTIDPSSCTFAADSVRKCAPINPPNHKVLCKQLIIWIDCEGELISSDGLIKVRCVGRYTGCTGTEVLP
jgi:hypothetical protein